MNDTQLLSMDLNGKVALIVGGGAGMGEQSALKLGAAGCSVVVADVDERAAQNVAAKITANSGKATAFVGDALDSANVADLISRIEQQVGGIDILVCIVGQAHWSQFLDLSLADFDRDHQADAIRLARRIAINLQAQILLLTACTRSSASPRMNRFLSLLSVHTISGRER